jgi:hypothetical protein
MSNTDLQTLVTLFATTYSPNPNERTAAELQIRRVRALRARAYAARTLTALYRSARRRA